MAEYGLMIRYDDARPPYQVYLAQDGDSLTVETDISEAHRYKSFALMNQDFDRAAITLTDWIMRVSGGGHLIGFVHNPRRESNQ